MSEQILTVLKFCLVALLYLFLARVVWVVATELRGTPAPVQSSAAPPAAAPRATRTRRRWRLVVHGSGEPGPELWVDGEATIGRGAGCGLPLAHDTFVSQVHARVVDRDGDLWIEDLGSTNGTLVNGRQVAEPRRLRKGDRVQIGETRLEVDRS